jgi:hypothetical protein
MKITANEKLALAGLSSTSEPEYYLSFRAISDIGGLHQSLVRRTVRQLARKGLAVYAKGLWSDSGEPRGAGYALTKAGTDILDEYGLRVSEFVY